MQLAENGSPRDGLEQLTLVVIDGAILSNVTGLNAFVEAELEPRVGSGPRWPGASNELFVATKTWIQ